MTVHEYIDAVMAASSKEELESLLEEAQASLSESQAAVVYAMLRIREKELTNV